MASLGARNSVRPKTDPVVNERLETTAQSSRPLGAYLEGFFLAETDEQLKQLIRLAAILCELTGRPTNPDRIAAVLAAAKFNRLPPRRLIRETLAELAERRAA